MSKSQLIANEASLTDAKHSFVLYRYRFVIGLIFILASNNSTLMLGIFSPLQTTLSSAYGESLTYINFGTNLIANICYIPGNFVGNYVINKYGLRFSLVAGSLLTTIGLWIRCLARHNFVFILIGQVFCGFSQPVFFSTPPEIADTWFGADERTIATTVLLMCTNIGLTLSTFLPQFFVDINADNATILNQIHNMMFWFAIIGSVSLAIFVPLMRDKPPTPPSKAAAAVKFNFIDSLKTIVKDWNTMMLIVPTALIYSTVFNYICTMQQIVHPFGINGDQAGDLLSVNLLCSIVSAIAISPFFAKYRKFNNFLITISGVAVAVLVGNLFAAQSGYFFLYGASALIYAVLMAPVFPISIEYSIELSFPVAESVVSGLWYVINCILSTILSVIIDQILSANSTPEGSRWAFIAMLIFMIVGIIPIFWVKENLKRTKFEQEQEALKTLDEQNESI